MQPPELTLNYDLLFLWPRNAEAPTKCLGACNDTFKRIGSVLWVWHGAAVPGSDGAGNGAGAIFRDEARPRHRLEDHLKGLSLKADLCFGQYTYLVLIV